MLHSIIPFTYFLRVDRGESTGGSKSPKAIQINPQQLFSPEEYYVWLYEGSQVTTYIGGAVMVAIIFAGVLFPLWPSSMRLGVWYLSIGVLGLIGLFFVIAILRLIFYIITIVVASPGIWIFPQLFADVGFVSCCEFCFDDVLTLCIGGVVYSPVGVGHPEEEKRQEVQGRQDRQGKQTRQGCKWIFYWDERAFHLAFAHEPCQRYD